MVNYTDAEKGLKVVFSPQLVHFWGTMPQAYSLTAEGSHNGELASGELSVFEAYAEYTLTESFSSRRINVFLSPRRLRITSDSASLTSYGAMFFREDNLTSTDSTENFE